MYDIVAVMYGGGFDGAWVLEMIVSPPYVCVPMLLVSSHCCSTIASLSHKFKIRERLSRQGTDKCYNKYET